MPNALILSPKPVHTGRRGGHGQWKLVGWSPRFSLATRLTSGVPATIAYRSPLDLAAMSAQNAGERIPSMREPSQRTRLRKIVRMVIALLAAFFLWYAATVALGIVWRLCHFPYDRRLSMLYNFCLLPLCLMIAWLAIGRRGQQNDKVAPRRARTKDR